MGLILREDKGSKLTIHEMDGNLTYLENLRSGIPGPEGAQGSIGFQGYQGASAPELVSTSMVYVSKDGSDSNDGTLFHPYLTINKAITSISPSINNPYTIIVFPGVYVESTTIQMRPGVTLTAECLGAVIIIPSSNTAITIMGSENSSITNLVLNDANGIGGMAIHHEGSENTGAVFLVKDCNFNNNYIGVHCYSLLHPTYVYIESCNFHGDNISGVYVDTQSSIVSQVVMTSCTYRDVSAPLTLPFISVIGHNSSITITNTIMVVNPTSGSVCISVTNGGQVRAIGSSIRGFDIAIHSLSGGDGPVLYLNSLSIFDSLSYDIKIDNDQTIGNFSGIVDPFKTHLGNAPFYIYNYDIKIVTVAKRGAQFTKIADAVNSITDMSENNRYVINVNPGIYTEELIDMTNKPYISIVGSSIQSVIVEPDNDADIHDVFIVGRYNELSFLTIQNSFLGKAGISVYDTGDYSQIHKVSFNNCDIGVNITSVTQDTIFYGEYVDYNGVYSYGTKIVAQNGFKAYANLENYYNLPSGVTSSIVGTFVSGIGSELDMLASGNIDDKTGIGLYIEDGALVDVTSTHFHNWNIGIKVGNVGTFSTIKISGSDTSENTIDLLIEHPDTIGWITSNVPNNILDISSTSFYVSGIDIPNVQYGLSYSLKLDDKNKNIIINSTQSSIVYVPNVTDVPFSLGTEISITKYGLGQVLITNEQGVVIRSAGNKFIISDQYTTVSLYKVFDNEWLLTGGLV